MAEVSVITSRQLDGIRAKVNPAQPTNKTKRLEELHQLSKKRSEGWPNTLEAQRHRKERAKLERIAADEATKQVLEKEAAQAAAIKRRVVIERVNKMLFNETDKAKGFHGAILHSDVLAERREQIKFKGKVKVLKDKQETAFIQRQRELLAVAEQKELDKEQATKARALAQRDAQLQQLDDLKASILEEREQRRLEGEMLKEKAAKEEAEAQRAAEAARERLQQSNRDTMLANDTLQEFKRKEAEREAAADRAIESYAAKKAELLMERKRREAAQAADKEAKSKAMVELMESKFAEFMANEGERLERDVKQAEEKHSAELAERQRLRDMEWSKICASRTEQLEMRGAAKAEARAQEAAFRAAWQVRTQQLAQEQEEEVAERRARNEHYCAFQQHQVSAKQARKARSKVQALQDAAMVQEMSNDAEKRFQSYAKEYITEYQARGKPVQPMVLQLAKPTPFVSA